MQAARTRNRPRRGSFPEPNTDQDGWPLAAPNVVIEVTELNGGAGLLVPLFYVKRDWEGAPGPAAWSSLNSEHPSQMRRTRHGSADLCPPG